MTMATLAASLTYLSSPLNTFVPLPSPYDQYQFGHLNILIAAILIVASALSAPFGVKLTKKVSPTKARYAFAALILFMAIKMTFI